MGLFFGSEIISLASSFWPVCLSRNYWTIRGRDSIFHMCIPSDKTILSVPKFSTLGPYPWPLTYILKTLTLIITFEPLEVGLSYFTCVFLVTISFCQYQNFDLATLTVTFDLAILMLTAGGISVSQTHLVVILYFIYLIWMIL